MPKTLRPFKSLSDLQRELRPTQRKADRKDIGRMATDRHADQEDIHDGAHERDAPEAGPSFVNGASELILAPALAPAIIQPRAETKDTGQEENTPEPESEYTVPALARMHDMQVAPPGIVQRNWLGDAWDAVSSLGDLVSQGLEAGKRILLQQAEDVVSHIPGYRALGVVLGHDPITGEHIERNGHNFIEAAFDIMPGGELLHRKLSELGALADAERWVDEQMAAVENLVGNVRNLVANFVNDISLSSLAHPGDLLTRAGNIIASVVSNVVNFAVRAGTELLRIVKQFLLTRIVDFVKTQTEPIY
jgi:hypothetical protein